MEATDLESSSLLLRLHSRAILLILHPRLVSARHLVGLDHVRRERAASERLAIEGAAHLEAHVGPSHVLRRRRLRLEAARARCRHARGRVDAAPAVERDLVLSNAQLRVARREPQLKRVVRVLAEDGRLVQPRMLLDKYLRNSGGGEGDESGQVSRHGRLEERWVRLRLSTS